jgi:VWFA-related protein
MNVDLVQLEFFVTDSRGNYVNNLTSGSFSVKENGTEYPIQYFQFVPIGAPSGTRPNAQNSVQDISAQQFEGKQRRSDTKRSIVIFLDDLGMSAQSLASVHTAVKTWIEKSIREDDIVGIVSSSGQLGNFQQMTTDKRFLTAAVDRFHSTPNRRIGIQDGDFSCFWFNHRSTANRVPGLPTNRTKTAGCYSSRSVQAVRCNRKTKLSMIIEILTTA